jgi:adenosylcobyric acid synthase
MLMGCTSDAGKSFLAAGTWACLLPAEQARLRGFVLNKFRGDPALLGDARDELRATVYVARRR